MKLANEKKEKKIPGGSHKEAIFFLPYPIYPYREK